ncbi:MAG: hypothetical protein O7I93_01965 [Gemmatimonadetes bacterium]|nr:hypothetical protein [Gemmatimonadota bacterium]
MDTDAQIPDRTGATPWTHRPWTRALAVVAGLAAAWGFMVAVPSLLPSRWAGGALDTAKQWIFLLLLLATVLLFVIPRRKGNRRSDGATPLNGSVRPPTHAVLLLAQTAFLFATAGMGMTRVLDMFGGMRYPPVATMKSDLRNLVSAQQAFHASFARYGTLDEIGDDWPFSNDPTLGLQVLLLRADSVAFDAAATTEWTPSLTCGVWLGEPSLQVGRPETPEAEVSCWDTPNEDRGKYRTIGAAR